MGILDLVERRASVENPSTSLADPDAWLVDLFGGGQAASGVHVNPKNALQLSAVWACVNVLAQDVAKLPLITYERLDRGKRRALDHPVYSVLHDEANPQMSAYNFRSTIQAHVVTWGDGFAEIEFAGDGSVRALWPLLPDRTEAIRRGGEKFIRTRIGSEWVILPADRVLHVSGLGFDGLRGYSVITMAKESIGSAMAAEQFGSSFFGNGARPGGVITTKHQLTEQAQDRLRRSWNKIHQGLTNQQRLAILDEGMDYQSIGIPPEDAQFIATRQHGVEDIARFFRVPPHKIQHLLRSTFSNEESQERSYLRDALQSWLVNWEQEISRSLFRPEERTRFFAEHNVEGLLRGNAEARSSFYQSGINNGWLSVNDVREFENMNPVEGGDRHFVPLNLIPLDMGADAFSVDEDEDMEGASLQARMQRGRERRSLTERHRLQQNHLSAFREIAGRLVSRETSAIREITDSTLGRRDAADFMAEVRRFYEGFENRAEEEFLPLLMSYGSLIREAVSAEVGSITEPDPNFERFLRDYTDGMARRHTQKSVSQIQAIVRDTDPEEVAEAIGQRMDEWEQKRPGKIAMVESVRSMGALSKAAYVAAGVISLVWRAVGAESCPFCERLNGQVVGVRDAFANVGDEIEPTFGDNEPMVVRQTTSHPPIHSGCDCLVSAAF